MDEVRELVRTQKWYVLRTGTLEVVNFTSGSVRFCVKISDVGREPFITQWFNDIVPASDFLDRVMGENEELVRQSLEEAVDATDPE
jgi:hypothetical protein